MKSSRYKVIQWATGAVGTHALRALVEDPQLDLVGVYVHSPGKVGRDAGELAGLPVHTGITATDDAELLRATAADCVVYTAPPIHTTRSRTSTSTIWHWRATRICSSSPIPACRSHRICHATRACTSSTRTPARAPTEGIDLGFPPIEVVVSR